MDLGFINFA